MKTTLFCLILIVSSSISNAQWIPQTPPNDIGILLTIDFVNPQNGAAGGWILLILEHTPIAAQIVFFGAVLSAVMSCSSATLLAPSVALSENVLKPMVARLNDAELLRMMRTVLVIFAAVVLAIALWSDASIYKLVVSTYKVTLVVAFIPLLAGLYRPKATTQGAILAIAGGLVSWLGFELISTADAVWPPSWWDCWWPQAEWSRDRWRHKSCQ